jgi:hypothetical protein
LWYHITCAAPGGNAVSSTCCGPGDADQLAILPLLKPERVALLHPPVGRVQRRHQVMAALVDELHLVHSGPRRLLDVPQLVTRIADRHLLHVLVRAAGCEDQAADQQPNDHPVRSHVSSLALLACA